MYYFLIPLSKKAENRYGIYLFHIINNINKSKKISQIQISLNFGVRFELNKYHIFKKTVIFVLDYK